MSPHSATAAEIRCQHCGQATGAQEVFCSHCGRGISDKLMGRGAEQDIYLMLVTGNVLRLRRQWRLAEAKCSEVLRRDPENAAAHSLLGDISRDQGKLRDAIEWYKMALDRNPGSATDRKKLEAVIDEVFSGRSPGLVTSAGAKFREELGGLAADVRGVRLPSSLVAVVGMALGIVLVIAASAILLGRPEMPAAEGTTREASSGGFQTTSPEKADLPVAPVEIESAGRPAQEALADQAVSLESGLSERLSARARALDPNCEILSVELDAKAGMVRLWLRMPQVWGAAATRAGISRMAVALGVEAASWDERISGVRVRCDMRDREGTERMALAAEGSARDLAKASPAAGETSEEAFDFVWWHPELRE